MVAASSKTYLLLCILVTLSLLFSSSSTAARPLPHAPTASPAPTLLNRAASMVSNSFKLMFDSAEPAAHISMNPHRLDGYIRAHLATVGRDAARVLESKGHSIMASFLESQLMGLADSQERVLWTIFAPADEDLRQGNFGDLSSLLMTHLLPGRDVALTDLKLMANGTRFLKNMDGVPMQLTKNRDQLMVNGVEITDPDLFHGPWIVVHGINGVIHKQSMEDQQVLHHETDGFYTHAEHSGFLEYEFCLVLLTM